MKVNADYREFKNIEEIADNFFEMLCCLDSNIANKKNIIKFIGCYLNDWYYDYQLTSEECDEIEQMVKEWWNTD